MFIPWWLSETLILNVCLYIKWVLQTLSMSEIICRMSWSCRRSSPCLKMTGYCSPSSVLKMSFAGIRALWKRRSQQSGVVGATLCTRYEQCIIHTLKSVAVSGMMPLMRICGSRGRGMGSISDRFTFSLSANRLCKRSVCQTQKDR